MNETKNKHLIKQLCTPEKHLTVVLNNTDENGKTVNHYAFDVAYLAVCFDGVIRPVVLAKGSYLVFDKEDEGFSGFYTDGEMDRMIEKCKHPMIFFR